MTSCGHTKKCKAKPRRETWAPRRWDTPSGPLSQGPGRSCGQPLMPRGVGGCRGPAPSLAWPPSSRRLGSAPSLPRASPRSRERAAGPRVLPGGGGGPARRLHGNRPAVRAGHTDSPWRTWRSDLLRPPLHVPHVPPRHPRPPLRDAARPAPGSLPTTRPGARPTGSYHQSVNGPRTSVTA